MHLVFRQPCPCGDAMFDKLVMDNIEPEALGKPGSYISAQSVRTSRASLL